MNLSQLVLFAAVASLVNTPSSNAPSPTLRSGLYGESLRVAVNEKEKTVTGYFSSAGGYSSGEGWDCNFYFSGMLKNNATADIVAVSTNLKVDEVRADSRGTLLKSASAPDTVILKLNNGVSGCERGEDFIDESPSPRRINLRNDPFEPAELRRRNNSFEFRLVKVRKAHFYEAEGAKQHNRSYVTCGDIVLVKEKSSAPKRAKAVYFGAKKATEGWLNEEDLLEIGTRLHCPRD